MVGGCVGKRYQRSEDVGSEVILCQRSIFRPASDTPPGQERERRERPRTEDCWVLE